MKYLKILIVAITILLCIDATAQVVLPKLISDGMILQRDAKLKIWGWSSPGESIAISFKNKTFKTVADNVGNWQLILPPQKAGGPFTMKIKGKNQINISDILIGDVWLCSGQSNMEHQMSLHSVLYADEIARANYKEIRQFKVPNTINFQQPQKDLPGGVWKWANPQDVLAFSAVAYFFAKDIYEKYKVPVGIINASWGGTPIEAWMSEESLKDFPSIRATAEKNKDTAYINSMNRNSGNIRMSQPEDKGLTGNWFDAAYVPKGWRNIAIPGYWEDQGVRDLDGVVWYRKEIDVPASMTNVPAKVFLGRIVDADALYINGKQVGATTYMYPQRLYQLPEGTLKQGKNLFVIRVTNNFGKGGFVPDKPYQLITDKDTIDLTGYWQYKVGQVNRPRSGGGGGGMTIHYQPTVLYNAMLAPLTGYSIKGFVWYQGESNAGRPDEYAKLQPTMIQDWRKKWSNNNLPFLFVQLPGFGDYNYLPAESQWAKFREAQAKSLSVPNTGMAVAIDLGEWNDIHPDRKKEVGDRLALAAQKIAYNENIVYSGPTYQSFKTEGNKMILSFTNIGGGLTTSDGEELSDFAIAGADQKFLPAKAMIDGDKVVVWNDEVPEPKYVRYAWADNPVNPNLINREGLPGAPFETVK